MLELHWFYPHNVYTLRCQCVAGPALYTEPHHADDLALCTAKCQDQLHADTLACK